MQWKTLLCCCLLVPIDVHAASGTSSEPGVLALFALGALSFLVAQARAARSYRQRLRGVPVSTRRP
jgi:hypothetical protein